MKIEKIARLTAVEELLEKNFSSQRIKSATRRIIKNRKFSKKIKRRKSGGARPTKKQ